jgi:GTP cyclohydrolase I
MDVPVSYRTGADMSEKTSHDDEAMIAEALRRMKSNKPAIPAKKVREFLNRLNEEWDRAEDLTPERIREMFERFVAEASHVSS